MLLVAFISLFSWLFPLHTDAGQSQEAPEPARTIVPATELTFKARPIAASPVLGYISKLTDFDSPARPTVIKVIHKSGQKWIKTSWPHDNSNAPVWTRWRANKMRLRPIHILIDINLRKELLTLFKLNNKKTVVFKTSIESGGEGTPTPTGTFGVTDKLEGQDFSSVYGCCILALSGIQPAVSPPNNRLAIHGVTGGELPSGNGSSLGCIHVSDYRLQQMMWIVPLGTKVSIHN